MKLERLKRGLLAEAGMLCLILAAAGAVKADTSFTADKWVDSLKFGGDMRLRDESLFIKSVGAGNNDEDRQRIRLRYGVTASMQPISSARKLVLKSCKKSILSVSWLLITSRIC